MTLKELHLEDWITNNPQGVWTQEEGDEPVEGWKDGESSVVWDGRRHYIETILARQLRLPSGRADLITESYHEDSLTPEMTVIELKRDAIDAKSVVQCLRYMHDLKEIFKRSAEISHRDLFLQSASNTIEECLGVNLPIYGILIGRKLDESVSTASLTFAKIVLLLYTYNQDADSYEFELVRHESSRDALRAYEDFTHGTLGEWMKGRASGLVAERKQNQEWDIELAEMREELKNQRAQNNGD